MKKLYVDMKSELSLIKQAYEAIGLKCYRVRTECDCPAPRNQRDALIVLNGPQLLTEVVRCKGCNK